jgi:hypothetical protein
MKEEMQNSEINGNIKDFFYNSEDDLLFEINSSKLKNFGKEHFQYNIEKSLSYEQVIKLSTQHFAFKLPGNLNEFFVSRELSKYFWISNHPLIAEIQDYSSSTEKNSLKENLEKDEIKKYYVKWVSEKQERERIFFAGTIINMIDKNNQPDDLLRYLMAATINLLEKKFHSSENFTFLINYVNDIILNSNIGEDTKKQFIYYLNIYKAFFNLSEKKYEDAKINLLDSLEVLPGGITAQFYLAIVVKLCGDATGSLNYIKNIILFDLERLTYAIDSSNLALFHFLISNTVSYYLFRNGDFADLFPQIKSIFESFNINGQLKLKNLSSLLTKLANLNVIEYYNDQINAEINFIDKFIGQYAKEKNAFILMVENMLFEKYYKLIDLIKEKFKSVNEEKLYADLVVFNKKIQSYQNEITAIESDIEESKEKIRTVHKESLNKRETEYNNYISEVEKSISTIDSREDFNPFVAFNNSIVYNFIISLIVFIIGGFIDGMSESHLDELKASSLILSVLVSGFKWSAMIFAIGLVVSVITMISKVIERSNEKQKLLRRISQLKVTKEREMEAIRKDMENKVKEFESNTKLRVERIKLQIENQNKEKSGKETVIREEVNKLILEFQNKLNTIFI